MFIDGRRVPTYEDFTQLVRRHRPTELLPFLAQLEVAQRQTWMSTPDRRALPPWALAAIAKESILRGNEHRSTPVTVAAIQRMSSKYLAMSDPLLEGADGIGSLNQYFTRTAYEQFVWQRFDFQDIARSWTLLVEMPRDVPTKVISEEACRAKLGIRLDDLLASAVVLNHAADQASGRLILEDYLPGDSDSADDRDFRASVTAALMGYFSSTIPAFRDLAAEQELKDRRLRRYDFNPLWAKPIVELGAGRYVAPIPILIARSVGLSTLYYWGLSQWDKVFSDDLGYLFQQYVGRQLGLLQGCRVRPEVRYDSNNSEARSIDWFVLCGDVTILVEVKSKRLTIDGRAGGTSLGPDIQDSIGASVTQIERTAALVRSGHPQFEFVPPNTTLCGLIVTMEPNYVPDTAWDESILPKASLSIGVADSAELETIVSARAGDRVAEMFRNSSQTRNQRIYSTRVARNESHLPHADNPILEQAWEDIFAQVKVRKLTDR